MRKYLLILLVMAGHPVFSQKSSGGSSSTGERNFRFRIGFGMPISLIKQQLFGDLKANGYGDTYHYTGIGFGLLDQTIEHPRSKSIPLTAEIMAERRMNKNGWLGLAFGLGPETRITGFDKSGDIRPWIFDIGGHSTGEYVTLTHSSWYLSPRYSIFLKDKKTAVWAGPALSLHTTEAWWRHQSQEQYQSLQKKQWVKAGAMLGLNVSIFRQFEWVTALHWFPGLQYDPLSVTRGGASIPSVVLPVMKTNFSYLRTGLSFYFP